MSKIKSFLLVFSVSVLALSFSPVLMLAEDFDPLDKTCEEAGQANNPICQDAANNEDITGGNTSVFTDVVNLLSFAAGVIAVVLIIIAGISMMTANGDSQKFQSARNTIIYTVVGIIVIVAARSIIIFIFNELSQ